MFDRPGFSRLDIENPEVDESPGGSARFGRTDLDDRSFFAGGVEEQSQDQPPTFFEPPADEQRPFFDDVEPQSRGFGAFTEPQPEPVAPASAERDETPIRDPYASLADLRSEPDPNEPEHYGTSFTDGAEPSAGRLQYEPETLAEDDKENTGSFFLPKPVREITEERPAVPDPSPGLRSFFETGAAERPDFRAEAGLDEETTATEPAYSWQPPTDSSYEPEILDDRPIRLDDDIVDAEVVAAAVTEPEPEPVVEEPEPVEAVQPEPVKVQTKVDPDFRAANTVEQDLLDAVQANSTDRFLSTLLLAKVLVPFWTGDGPVDPANWRTEHMNGLPHLVVFTSEERMAERLGPDARGSFIKFSRLIRYWPPGDQLAFAINPESPAGAVLPGTEVVQLATWAAELGLGMDDPDELPVAGSSPDAVKPTPRPVYEPPASARQQVMQKPISPEQLSHYLERNYDRVSGFVHRAGEVEHLTTPDQLYHAFGLGYAGSSFKPDAEESYVLRWIAYRGDLYRIPYGGPTHDAMRAMEGWVIERPPFRGNGFAPSDTSDVIAEFKVDSARLPHNAELWRIGRDGRQELIARLDADGPSWRKVTS